jgi:hypothetical protein
MAKLKVYGVTLIVNECPPAANGCRQARCIVASTSQSKAADLFGMTIGQFRSFGCETGNAKEIEVATAEPGVVFWSPLDWSEDRKFHRLKTKQE